MINLLNNLMTAAAETVEQTSGANPSAISSSISSIVMIVIMIVVFYFLLIRPQRKKDKAVKNMLNSLKTGDRICTIGGFYGTIAALKDDTVTLKLGSLENTVVIARWAIRSVENVSTENDSSMPEV